jgi:hypothetical protein
MGKWVVGLVDDIKTWWKNTPSRTLVRYAEALGLPTTSAWRLVLSFLLFLLLLVLFPIFLLVARIIVRRARARNR